MNKLLLTIAGVSALGLAAPAAAQFGSGIEGRIDQLQARIQVGVQNGSITRNEAMMLRQQLRQLRDYGRLLASDGLTRAERDQLQMRIQTLQQQIRIAERNRDFRNPRDRDWDDDRWDDDDRRYDNGRFCPPGLARKNNGCMPPGQVGRSGDRYQNQFGGLPSQYRNQFRDTNRYFYRYDNGRIYQVDRRTGTIVRVIDVRR
ncbi:MAG TPA: hypothetical protein VNT77_02400 [Allosphingosinicella sp.]|nr:hypothetical protein [Allosphingosinicella sp.]